RHHLDEPEAERGERGELQRDADKPRHYETDRTQDLRRADEEQQRARHRGYPCHPLLREVVTHGPRDRGRKENEDERCLQGPEESVHVERRSERAPLGATASRHQRVTSSATRSGSSAKGKWLPPGTVTERTLENARAYRACQCAGSLRSPNTVRTGSAFNVVSTARATSSSHASAVRALPRLRRVIVRAAWRRHGT